MHVCTDTFPMMAGTDDVVVYCRQAVQATDGERIWSTEQNTGNHGRRFSRPTHACLSYFLHFAFALPKFSMRFYSCLTSCCFELRVRILRSNLCIVVASQAIGCKHTLLHMWVCFHWLISNFPVSLTLLQWFRTTLDCDSRPSSIPKYAISQCSFIQS